MHRIIAIAGHDLRLVLGGRAKNLTLEIDPDASREATLVAQARIIKAIAAVIGRLVEVRSSMGADRLPNGEDLLIVSSSDELVQVTSRFAGQARIAPGGFAQSIPGNTVMFVMLVALTFGASSVSGLRGNGILRRLATTPASRDEIVAGIVAGRLVIAWLQIAVLMAVAVAAGVIFAIETGDHHLTMWIILTVYAFANAPLGVAFGAWITDPDRAASVGVIATMVMAAFGGCWWPLEIVSKPLQRLALAFPSGWAMKALHGTISFGRSLDELGLPLLVLLGFGLVFTTLAAKSLRLE